MRTSSGASLPGLLCSGLLPWVAGVYELPPKDCGMISPFQVHLFDIGCNTDIFLPLQVKRDAFFFFLSKIGGSFFEFECSSAQLSLPAGSWFELSVQVRVQ